MREVRRKIKQALKGAESPVVSCSFGKDSLLLLYLVREIRDIEVLWFRQRMTEEQKRFAEKIIKEWDLTAFSYAPQVSYVLPNNESVSLVDEYSFGTMSMPVITDIQEGESCIGNISFERTSFFNYPFDVTLTGWKSQDEHFITGRNPFPEDGFRLGNTLLYAPLRDLTDKEVLQAIKDLKIPYEEIDDSIKACTRCLHSVPVFCPEAKKTIPPVVWQPKDRLAEFRARFL